MQKEHRLELQGATYVMRPANATAAWRALKAAGAVFKGMAVSSETKSVDVGVLLGNLGDPAVAQIEDMVFEHTNVIPADGGQPFKLSARMDEHFNTCRDHMLPVLIAGIRYQYADFFSGAGAALLSQVTARFKALSS